MNSLTHRKQTFFTPCLLVLLAACGGSDSAGTVVGDGFTAVIDGRAWRAEPVSIVAQANAGVKNNLILTGSQLVDGKTLSLTLTVYNVDGPGTFAMGVGPGIFGGRAQLGEGTGVGGDAALWVTASTGVAGVLEVLSLESGRAQGTFAFTAQPDDKNPSTASRVVTEGKFNVPLAGAFMPLAENAGSKVSADFNGKPYFASSADGSLKDFTGGDGVRFSSLNSEQALSITLVGVTAPGTYPLSGTAPQRLMTAGRNGGDAKTCCWGVNAAGDVGEVIVTSLTSKRVTGTFSGTLKPQPQKPATADLVISNGVFSIGLP
jgi:hypothetical protein